MFAVWLLSCRTPSSETSSELGALKHEATPYFKVPAQRECTVYLKRTLTVCPVVWKVILVLRGGSKVFSKEPRASQSSVSGSRREGHLLVVCVRKQEQTEGKG